MDVAHIHGDFAYDKYDLLEEEGITRLRDAAYLSGDETDTETWNHALESTQNTSGLMHEAMSLVVEARL